MLDHTSCDGFWTGSSTERIPIERAVLAQARTFAAIRFSNR
jgi:predicted TIM-barrel enzyme